MKGMKKAAAFLISAMTVLFVFTGCSEESVQSKGKTGYLGIVDSVSRGVNGAFEDFYKKEDLYWTYTAVKKNDSYTEGQKLTQFVIGEPLPEPTRAGNHKGLEKPIGPLAVGDWEIKLYGYLNDTEPSETEPKGYATNITDNTLVYQGSRILRIEACDKDSAYSINRYTIDVESPETLNGYLSFASGFTFNVPEKMVFVGSDDIHDELIVKVVDVTEGRTAGEAKVIAKSVTDIAAGKHEEGETITLGDFKLQPESTVYPDNRYPISVEGGKYIHNFEVIVEYKDGWTEGNSEYLTEGSHSQKARYKSGSGENFVYDVDYAPVGEVISFPLRFVSGVELKLSGDMNDLKANGGEIETVKFGISNVAIKFYKLEGAGYVPDTSRTNEFFSDFGGEKGAIARWLVLGGNLHPDTIRIELLDNLEPEGTGEIEIDTSEVTGENGIVIYPGSFYVKNIKLTGTSGQLQFWVPETDSTDFAKYAFSTAGTVIKNFKCVDKLCHITTEGGTEEIKTKDHTVYVSGEVDKLYVGVDGSGSSTYQGTVKVGIKDSTVTEIEELGIKSGKVELGGLVKIEKLAISGTVPASPATSLKGTETTEIGNFSQIVSEGVIYEPGATSATSINPAQSSVFKKIVLKANNGSSTARTVYSIEGMMLELPSFSSFSPASAWTKTDSEGTNFDFMHWNTQADASGTVYRNKQKFVTGGTDADLYAVWAQQLGGRVFYIDSAATGYHFYGADGGELTWQSATVTDDLASAVYGNCLGTEAGKAYVVWTKEDPKTSVTASEVSYYQGENYKYFDDRGMSSVLAVDGLGKGKSHTGDVLGSGTALTDDLFAGIEHMRSVKERGHNDWFIGTQAEYRKLTDPVVRTLSKTRLITSLTVTDETGTDKKVYEFDASNYTNTWSEVEYSNDKAAYLVPLRCF